MINPKSFGTERLIPIRDLDVLESLLSHDEQEFHLIIVDNQDSQEKERIKKEIENLEENDRQKLKVFIYVSKSKEDFADAVDLVNKFNVIRQLFSEKSVVISKRLLTKKPKIFCANNSKIKQKLSDFFAARPNIDKFSTFVFYSQETSKKEILDRVKEMKQKYPKTTFVETSALGWTSNPSSNKLVIIKKKSKFTSLSNVSVTANSRNTYVKEFTVGDSTFQWIPAHVSLDSVDQIMDRFNVFSQRESFDDWEEKQFHVKMKVNRNKITNKEYHNFLEMCRDTKAYSLIHFPKVFFTLHFSDDISDKVEIFAEDLGHKKLKKKVLGWKHNLTPEQHSQKKEIFKKWNHNGMYSMDSDLKKLNSKKINEFIKKVLQGKAKRARNIQREKPYSFFQHIGYNDFKNLSRDGSNQDAVVYVYQENCGACNFMGPLLNTLSLSKFSNNLRNVRFYKLDSSANFGFYSTPNVYYIKYGSENYFEFKRQINRLQTKKNLEDFLFLSQEVGRIKEEDLDFTSFVDSYRKIDLSWLNLNGNMKGDQK
jgi:hypothetical protein